jgi:hypothetical protein
LAPAAVLIGIPLIDDCPLVGGDGDDASAAPPLTSPTDDAEAGDLTGDGDLFLVAGNTGKRGDSGDIGDSGDSGECRIESRVEFSACSACTTSAKLMKLRRRGSVVSMAPYDDAASSKSMPAASCASGDESMALDVGL